MSKKTKPDQTEKIESYHSSVQNPKRRDFIVMSSTAIVCTGAVMASVPFISSWSPDQNELAVGSIEVNLNDIKKGNTQTIMWRGSPLFVCHRTEQEIKEAQEVDWNLLKDPQPDSERVKPGHEQWLIVIGVCTHLGCVPIAEKNKKGGWLCPCHGSYYDSSGRIIKGPAPKNLVVPPYKFINSSTIKVG